MTCPRPNAPASTGSLPPTLNATGRAVGSPSVPEFAEPSDLPRLLPFPNREGPGTPALPRPRTPLLGRDQEIDALSTLLVQDDVALVTLTGPGGIGKTQLALAVASRLQAAFPSGAWFVDLSTLRDPSLVPLSIAQALDLRDAAGVAPLDRLREHLATRQALLVLDNLEHVTAAAPAIATLLSSCPRLAVLATSRVPLRLSAEQRFPVRPLPTPEPGSSPTLPAVQELAAVQLFARAAQTVEPGFALSADNAATVAAICARLDGVPLAIELAAARCNVLSPAALLARLDHALPLLADGPRDVPDRLRTMGDAIAWSYDLLDAPDQHLLRRLAVFTGGFTEDAAAFVAPDADGSSSILPRLTGLVEHSLLVATDADGQPRFTMLATIQEFSLEQLDRLGETAAVRDRHAAWVLDLVEHANPWWHTAAQAQWLDTLEREHANLRAALAWLTQSGDRVTFVRLASLAWRFWSARFHWVEGSRWLRQAETWSQAHLTVEPLRVRVGLGNLLLWLSDEPAARAVLTEALAVAEASGDVSPLDGPEVMLGVAAQIRGDLDESFTWYDKALAAHRALGDTDSRALPEVGHSILKNMAWVEIARNDVRRAETLATEALAIQRRLGLDGGGLPHPVPARVYCYHLRQREEATRMYRESLELAWAHRDLQLLVGLFTEYAEFDRDTGHGARAAGVRQRPVNVTASRRFTIIEAELVEPTLGSRALSSRRGLAARPPRRPGCARAPLPPPACPDRISVRPARRLTPPPVSSATASNFCPCCCIETVTWLWLRAMADRSG